MEVERMMEVERKMEVESKRDSKYNLKHRKQTQKIIR